jgi:hypothetical protein
MSPKKKVNLQPVVCEEELWPNYFRRFVARYADGPRWPVCLVALLWIAERYENDIRYLDLRLSTPGNDDAEIADVWDSPGEFPAGHKETRFNDTFEDQWCKAVQEIRESIKQGELPCDNDGIRRDDAVRWLRAQGVEVDPTVPDAAPAAAREAKPESPHNAGRRPVYSLKKDDMVWAAWRHGRYQGYAAFLAENPQPVPYDTVEGMRKLAARMKQRRKNAGDGD